MENKLADKVIAMDVNKGPVEIAKKNIKLYGMDDCIEVRLSDGTEKLSENEVDTLLISGMGGALTVRILSMRPEIIARCKYLVLSPQSELFLVREYLRTIGFKIIKEDMVKDEEKYYVGIKALNTYNECRNNNICVNGNSSNNENISVFDRFGEYLLLNRNDVLKEYLIYSLNQNEDILLQLESAYKKGESDSVRRRIKEIKELINNIKEGMKYYGM